MLKNKGFDGISFFIILGICIMLISFFMGDFSVEKVEPVPYSEFVQYMNNGEVKSVTTYEDNQAQVELNDGKKLSVVLPSKTMFIDLYHYKQIPYLLLLIHDTNQ